MIARLNENPTERGHFLKGHMRSFDTIEKEEKKRIEIEYVERELLEKSVCVQFLKGQCEN